MKKSPEIYCSGLFLCLFFSLVMLSGCYSLEIKGFSDQPLLLNRESVLKGQKYQVIRHFYRQKQVEYFFGNMQGDPVIQQILKEETQGRAGVLNLRVQRQYQPLDVVVSFLTLGIFSRSIVIVEGDVVVWQTP